MESSTVKKGDEATVEPDAVDDVNGTAPPSEADKARQEIEDDINKLDPDSDPDPLVEPKRYVIGKPPERGGEPEEYSVYIQRVMGYVQMLRFTGMVSKTVAESIKQGSAIDLGDAFNNSSGTAAERAKQIVENSFNDAGSFAALFFQLVGYSPDLILETYCFALEIPNDERRWAKKVMEQRWDPEENAWGLRKEDGQEILIRFIDQNYDEMRDFFVDLIKQIVAHVQANEKRHASESAPSKS